MTTTAGTSAARAEASRVNGRKSIGAKTPEGKSRIRLNGLKHGLTARTIVLPHENGEVLDARVTAWKQDIRPQSAMEEDLVERAAHLSWQLDRANRVIAARLSGLMTDGPADQAVEEADLVAGLGCRLFWDPWGPIALYPHFPGVEPTPRISSPATVDDPLNPARIVIRLELLPAGADGCSTAGSSCAPCSTTGSRGRLPTGYGPFACSAGSRWMRWSMSACSRSTWPATPWSRTRRRPSTTWPPR